jgi:hypothetical protein
MEFLNAQEYTPESTDSVSDAVKNGLIIGATFHRDSLGNDWYENLSEWGEDTLKIKVSVDGEILSFGKDVQGIVPSAGHSVYETDELPEGFSDKCLGKCKFIDGKIVLDIEENEYLQEARSYVSQSLRIADIEIAKHLDGDGRAISTEQAWRDHRKKLRDYVKNGVVADVRPVAPE